VFAILFHYVKNPTK